MKNFTLTLACVAFSLPSYAYIQPATVNPDNNSIIVLPAPNEQFAPRPIIAPPHEVTLPALSGGFVIGLTGNYLAPATTHGDLNYALSPRLNSGNVMEKINPPYYYGWGINVDYAFANTSNDIGANYFHYDMNDVIAINDSLADITPFNSANLFTYHHADAKANFALDQADITGGQYIDIGSRLRLHSVVGIRGIDLQRQFDHNFVTRDFITREAIREKSDFTGLGPLLGTDAEYEVGYNLGLVAHVDTSLMVGNINSELHDNLFINGFTPVSINQVYNNSTRRIVPVFDEKFGVNYTYAFYNDTNAAIIIEAGYQLDQYFNSVDRIYFNNSLVTTGDFNLKGPYINLAYRTI